MKTAKKRLGYIKKFVIKVQRGTLRVLKSTKNDIRLVMRQQAKLYTCSQRIIIYFRCEVKRR